MREILPSFGFLTMWGRKSSYVQIVLLLFSMIWIRLPVRLPLLSLCFSSSFLAVQNSSIGDLVPWSVRPSVTTNNQTLQSDPRDLRPLRHLIRVMKRHDLTGLFWCDSRDLWPLWHLFRVMRWPDLTKKTFAMLWHLRHWLQYRQLRTWIHDNLCFLTINCDTGQHSQFLRCFCDFEHVQSVIVLFGTGKPWKPCPMAQ